MDKDAGVCVLPKCMALFASWFAPKRMLGVDVGTASIKIVELSRWGQGKTLENYAQVVSSDISSDPLLNTRKEGRLLSAESVAQALKALLKEARIRTRVAVFSLPDFSTFSTTFEIPRMPAKEIPSAIGFNASQYLTLPVDEVTLDWQLIGEQGGKATGPVKVFLVAVPNQVVQEYRQAAQLAGLRPYALEAESMSLVRSLARNVAKTICLMDVGVQSSTISIVDRGSLKRSYSFNFYSNQLVSSVAAVTGMDYDRAEGIKNAEGLFSKRQGVAETLYVLIDPLLAELKAIAAEFQQREQKSVEAFYLTGGTANLPGLKEYFAESLGKEVRVPNCFDGLLYPPILEETLKKMASSFSVAVGAALGGLDL